MAGLVATAKGSSRCTVDDDRFIFQLAFTTERTQQIQMRASPDSKFLPLSQTSSGGLTAAAHRGGRNVAPEASGAQHVPNDRQHGIAILGMPSALWTNGRFLVARDGERLDRIRQASPTWPYSLLRGQWIVKSIPPTNFMPNQFCVCLLEAIAAKGTRRLVHYRNSATKSHEEPYSSDLTNYPARKVVTKRRFKIAKSTRVVYGRHGRYSNFCESCSDGRGLLVG